MKDPLSEEKGPWKAFVLTFIMLISTCASLSTFYGSAQSSDYASRINYASVVPYHGAANEELTGEACLQMVFDLYGPSITQQDIRNVTMGRLESGTADPEDIVRAGHFSSASRSKSNPAQQGYSERAIGYGVFIQDWTNNRRDPSPRFNSRFEDIYRAITPGKMVMVYMYKDTPPEINPEPDPNIPNIDPQNPNIDPNPQPPDPQVTPEDLAALEKVWRLVVGYDTEMGEGEFILHDPLPEGEGFAGGREIRVKLSEFDRLWNVTNLEGGTISTHRIGVSVCPWDIDLSLPDNERVEAGTEFEITANVTYSAPPNMNGLALQDSRAVLDYPEDYELVDDSMVKSISLQGPRSYYRVTWKLRAPERSYKGQDNSFRINASGQVVSTSPAYRDNIGGSTSFEVETYGYLNHPPVISAASVSPDRIPNDGSVFPVITCQVDDQDGNLREVYLDLTDIGREEKVLMYDNGRSGGDETANDGIYTYTIRDEISQGTKTLMIVAEDSKDGIAKFNLTLEVEELSAFRDPPSIDDRGLYPGGVPNDAFTTSVLWAVVTDPDDDVYEVTADLTPVGGQEDHVLYDDGSSGDLIPNDMNYSSTITVPPTVPLGYHTINITAGDTVGLTDTASIEVQVILPPVAPVIEDVQADPESVPNDGESEVVISALILDGNEDIEEVYANLNTLGGASKEIMNNDGIYPDLEGGDDIWSLVTTVKNTVTTGNKQVEITAVDTQGFDDSKKVTVTVIQSNNEPRIVDYIVEDRSVSSGEEVKVFVNITDEDGDIREVILDLSEIGGGEITLNDDAQSPDVEASDLVFSGSFVVPGNLSDGVYNITIIATDLPGDTDSATFTITVSSASQGDGSTLPQELFIGVPIALGVFLLIILLFLFLRKRSPKGPPMQGRPPQFRPTSPPGRPPYQGPYGSPQRNVMR